MAAYCGGLKNRRFSHMTESRLLAIAVITLLAVVVLLRRAMRRHLTPKQRVVEPPNSAFASELVRHRERAARWSGIEAVRLHPVNRQEVERLLKVVSASGVSALSERDLVFLDHLSGLTSKG